MTVAPRSAATAVDDVVRLGRQRTGHHRHARLDDAGLFEGDFFQRVARDTADGRSRWS